MTTSEERTYPLVDIGLARRLEKTEATANIEFVEARAKVAPALGAQWQEIGGTFAMFDGAGSPLTQTFGLGMFEPVTSETMASLEGFFKSRGADVFHEVSPLSDPTSLSFLNERNYRPIEFTSVMFRPINQSFRLGAQRNETVKVRLIRAGEESLWAETAVKGWSEFAELADFLRELGEVNAQSKSLSFLAEMNGAPIATGALGICDDVAILAGASTIPEARRNGAQLALLEERLRFAAEKGCDTAMMCASPGSASQRNAERHGFRIAYTRIKWQL